MLYVEAEVNHCGMFTADSLVNSSTLQPSFIKSLWLTWYTEKTDLGSPHHILSGPQDWP